MSPDEQRDYLLSLMHEHQALAGKERPRRRHPIRRDKPAHDFAPADRTCPRCHYTYASRYGELWHGGICIYCFEDLAA